LVLRHPVGGIPAIGAIGHVDDPIRSADPIDGEAASVVVAWLVEPDSFGTEIQVGER
jgi:hypothetical protein